MWTGPLDNEHGGAISIVLRLTAIMLLLRPMGPWWIAPFILAIAGLALVFPRVLHSSTSWYALALLSALRIAYDWPLADNHIYLLSYWCLAIALALGGRSSDRILRTSGRILIGLAFLFAVIWKAGLSPDYLDGRFFHVTLLTDPRFENFTQLVGGLTPEQLSESREFLRPLPEGAEVFDGPVLHESQALTSLSIFSTWATVVVEALCAGLFLLPLNDRFTKLRHIALLLFCIATYAIAPVAGFGWLLLTMGLATLNHEAQNLRVAYVCAWILVLLYDGIPWASLLVDILN